MAASLPCFEVMKADKSFELRKYSDLIMVKVNVPGPYELAKESGWRVLREYFEGNNFKNRTIHTSSPLIMASMPQGWEVSCYLPLTEVKDSLPKPVDFHIGLEEIPSRQVAVMRSRGAYAYPDLLHMSRELEDWINKEKLTKHSLVRLVKYNFNSFFPLLRKYEVQIDVVREII